MTVRNLFLESDDDTHVAGVQVDVMDGAWPTSHESGFPLLRGLDPHGTTVFNRLQAFGLEEELTRLRSTLSNTEQRGAIESALDLVRRCQRGGKLFLRFDGD